MREGNDLVADDGGDDEGGGVKGRVNSSDDPLKKLLQSTCYDSYIIKLYLMWFYTSLNRAFP